MTQQVTKHYEALCDMPRCICPAMPVAMFLKNGLLTTDAKPYIEGVVISVTEDGSGGIDVVISYDDTTMPTEEETLVVVSFGDEGTACDPDCLDECSWLSKVLSLQATGSSRIINRFYQLFGPDEDVTTGVFDIARIPFPTGFRLTDVRLTCYTYDINTTLDVTLQVGADLKAHATGQALGAQVALTIDAALLPYDGKPVLTIPGLTNGVYGMAAKGLVLELIGIIEP